MATQRQSGQVQSVGIPSLIRQLIGWNTCCKRSYWLSGFLRNTFHLSKIQDKETNWLKFLLFLKGLIR